MNGKHFLDTNVFVYMFDRTAPEKQAQAKQMVQEALVSSTGIISTQVIQEFLNVASRKFSVTLSVEDSHSLLRRVLYPLCQINPDLELYEDSLWIQAETGYAFYDSLILAAAVRAGCDVLYSEDMQHGRVVRGTLIQNPFQGLL